MSEQDKHDENLQRMRAAVDRKADDARQQAEQESLVGNDRQQEQLSVRAKNSGHGKKTADKWNQ